MTLNKLLQLAQKFSFWESFNIIIGFWIYFILSQQFLQVL